MQWRQLSNRKVGFKFRRQHPVGPYVADFYCDEALLVVELDGYWTHLGRRQEDRARDQWMAARVLKVVRVSASAVTRNAEDVAEYIGKIARQRGEELKRRNDREPRSQ